MQDSMIIQFDNGRKEYNICLNCQWPFPSNDAIKSDNIPIFYSTQHAKDSGWVYTNNIRYCPPSEKVTWVCPKCIEEDIK